jgi:hypothetical protein
MGRAVDPTSATRKGPNRQNGRPRRVRAAVVGLLALAAVGAVLVAIWARGSGSRPIVAACRASAGSASYPIDPEQAANATTIAAVGKRMGLPDHAVTVALAAAFQESGLHNLAHGDRDSVGLFQQRPSQGWGAPSQLIVPSYAAGAFFSRLATVDGWQTASVTVAAQQVQHSAAPDAYAQWEAESRVIAQALTGEVPAGLSCHFSPPSKAAADPAVTQAMSGDAGPVTLGTAFPVPRGWLVAGWLVGHAQQYRITSVAFQGQRWTATTGAWKPDSSADSTIQITPALPA